MRNRNILAGVLSVLWGTIIGVTGCGESSSPATRYVEAKLDSITVIHGGKEIVVKKGEQAPLDPGDTIRTSPTSMAIVVDQGHKVCLNAATEVVFKSAARVKEEDPSMVVHLVKGAGQFFIPPGQASWKGDRFQVETNSVIAAVRGTRFRVEVPESGKTEILVREGKVALLPPPSLSFDGGEGPEPTLEVDKKATALMVDGKVSLKIEGASEADKAKNAKDDFYFDLKGNFIKNM